MKWQQRSPYHLESDCGRWIINKAGEPPVYMLVALRPSRIVCVGTLAECKAAAK